MQDVREDCGFAVGIVVNGGGRQGMAGDRGGLRRQRVTAGDCLQPQSYEETPGMADDGRG